MKALVAGLLVIAFAAQAQQIAPASAGVTSADQKIGYEGARHLLNRAGFGASDAEIRELAPLTRAQAVDRLLAGSRREPVIAPPAFAQAPFLPYYRIRDMNAEERMAELRTRLQQGL